MQTELSAFLFTILASSSRTMSKTKAEMHNGVTSGSWSVKRRVAYTPASASAWMYVKYNYKDLSCENYYFNYCFYLLAHAARNKSAERREEVWNRAYCVCNLNAPGLGMDFYLWGNTRKYCNSIFLHCCVHKYNCNAAQFTGSGLSRKINSLAVNQCLVNQAQNVYQTYTNMLLYK